MKSLFTALYQNRLLIFEMAKRDIKDRYVGQVFGYIWFFINSIFTISVYIFLFAFVYKSNAITTENFSLYLISGFVPWMFLTESMAKGVISISSNSSLVKQVVFPVEVLPVKAVLSSVVSLGLNLSILILFSLYSNGLNFITLMLPVALFFLVVFSLGVTFILSSVAVFLKDLKDIVQFFSFIGIYLVPIVYLETLVPRYLQPLTFLNPFTYIVYCFQDIFYYGSFNHVIAWFVFPLVSIIICLFGYTLFRKVKINFGNFL